MTSANSASGEPVFAVFAGDRVTNLFPRHEVIKLDDGTYIQSHKQVKLIVDGYGLTGFLDGTLLPPLRFIQTQDGTLAPNPSAWCSRSRIGSLLRGLVHRQSFTSILLHRCLHGLRCVDHGYKHFCG
ncbi:hypothetical protein PVK06_009935 [Gossypium arboreum]|uniref:Uncharacterized protein n=1 Tax=Gossypium arboreum TaxID=29729 RepID=A0ABR0QQ82_GOSAR|nr:hypothetical protein PVK06_009935 [Gossypium arboreum]